MNQYFSRWYDKDPVLSMSMRTLSTSDDATQISVALNLIKIIIEHSIQEHEFNNVEDIVDAVENGIIQRGNCRWYDIDSTVRTAIQMLEKCSPSTRQKVAIDMAQLVIEKIIQDDDTEDDTEMVAQSENVDKNLLLDLEMLSKDAPDIEIINDIDN